MNIPAPVWYIAAGAVAVFLVLRAIGKLGAGAADAAASAGEAVASSAFDFLHPSLSADVFNQPTIVDAVPVAGGGYTCPSGYTLKYGAHRGNYCLRDS